MIVLDTNVVSELMRPAPEPGVTSWIDSFDVFDILPTAVTAAELTCSVARLPNGRRRRELVQRSKDCWRRISGTGSCLSMRWLQKPLLGAAAAI